MLRKTQAYRLRLDDVSGIYDSVDVVRLLVSRVRIRTS